MLNISTAPVRVTDHAIIRYMERVHGFNMELVREHIAGICQVPAALQAKAVRAEGVKFVIENGAVVTVAPDTQRLSSTTRARAQEKIARAK